MTIGDVLAAVTAFTLLAGGWGSALVSLALFMPNVVERAEQRVSEHPLRCGVTGLIMLVGAGVPIFILSHALQGPGKLVPFALWAALLGLAAVGSSGMVSILASRISPVLPRATTLPKASLIYILSGLCPVFGWFLVTPVALCVSLGAGASALLHREQRVTKRRDHSTIATVAEAI